MNECTLFNMENPSVSKTTFLADPAQQKHNTIGNFYN
jgi:hypothetical protein